MRLTVNWWDYSVCSLSHPNTADEKQSWSKAVQGNLLSLKLTVIECQWRLSSWLRQPHRSQASRSTHLFGHASFRLDLLTLAGNFSLFLHHCVHAEVFHIVCSHWVTSHFTISSSTACFIHHTISAYTRLLLLTHQSWGAQRKDCPVSLYPKLYISGFYYVQYAVKEQQTNWFEALLM